MNGVLLDFYYPETADSKTLLMPQPYNVVATNLKDYGFALVENYIDVVTYDNDYSQNVNFYTPNYFSTIQCIDYSRINLTIAQLMQSHLIDYIEGMLANAFYVNIFVDTFYIKNYVISYQKKHQEHYLFILGFDRDTKEFIATDYFDFCYKSTQRVPYAAVMESTINYNIPSNYGIDCSGAVNFMEIFKLNPNTIRTPCIEVMKNRLELFINSTPLDTYDGVYYGIQFFDIMTERFKKCDFLPSKHFAFIMSHIYLMITRLKIMDKYGYEKNLQSCIYNLEKLYNDASILKNKHLKYMVAPMEELKNEVLSNLFTIKTSYYTELVRILGINK